MSYLPGEGLLLFVDELRTKSLIASKTEGPDYSLVNLPDESTSFDEYFQSHDVHGFTDDEYMDDPCPSDFERFHQLDRESRALVLSLAGGDVSDCDDDVRQMGR